MVDNENKINLEKYYDPNFKGPGSAGTQLKGYWDFIKIFEDKTFLNLLEKKLQPLFPCNLIGIELFGALFVAFLEGKRNDFHAAYFLKKRIHGNRKRLYGLIDRSLKTYLIDDKGTTLKTVIKASIICNNQEIIIDKIFLLKNTSNITAISIYLHRIPIVEIV